MRRTGVIGTDLAAEANMHHTAGTRDHRRALRSFLRCGRVLLEAKSGLPHGQWQAWVRGNLVFSLRRAERYMFLARGAKNDTVSFLKLEELWAEACGRFPRRPKPAPGSRSGPSATVPFPYGTRNAASADAESPLPTVLQLPGAPEDGYDRPAAPTQADERAALAEEVAWRLRNIRTHSRRLALPPAFEAVWAAIDRLPHSKNDD
jgi:hypothetical protein